MACVTILIAQIRYRTLTQLFQSHMLGGQFPSLDLLGTQPSTTISNRKHLLHANSLAPTREPHSDAWRHWLFLQQSPVTKYRSLRPDHQLCTACCCQDESKSGYAFELHLCNIHALSRSLFYNRPHALSTEQLSPAHRMLLAGAFCMFPERTTSI